MKNNNMVILCWISNIQLFTITKIHSCPMNQRKWKCTSQICKSFRFEPMTAVELIWGKGCWACFCFSKMILVATTTWCADYNVFQHNADPPTENFNFSRTKVKSIDEYSRKVNHAFFGEMTKSVIHVINNWFVIVLRETRPQMPHALSQQLKEDCTVNVNWVAMVS
jgi:hypothetical protein